MGGKSDGGKAAAVADSRAQAAKAAEVYEKIKIPEIEKQKLMLEELALVGNLHSEELGDSNLAAISLDPRYKQAQVSALQELQSLGKTGLGEQDRLVLSQIRDDSAAQNQAQQASILASMAERGSLDSGAQLAAQLNSSQQANLRAAQQGQQLAAQAADARRGALEQASNVAGNMSQQEYGNKAQLANARDIAAQFNAQNRFGVQQANLNNRQRVAESNVGTRNEEQTYNKELLQKEFNNNMSKAQGLSGAYANQANNSLSAADRATAKKGLGGTIGTLAGAAIGGFAAPPGMEAQGASAGGNLGGTLGEGFAEGGIKYLNGGLADLHNRKEDVQYHQPAEVFDPYARKSVGQRQKENSVYNNFGTFNPNVQKQTEGDSLGIGNSIKNWFASKPQEQIVAPSMADLRMNDEKALKSEKPMNYIDMLQSLSEQLGKRYADGGISPEAQKELLAMARGDIMPEDSSGGRIIGGKSFSGDKLPDRINSGEMVLNVPQQDNIKGELDKKTAQQNGFLKILEMIGKK